MKLGIFSGGASTAGYRDSVSQILGEIRLISVRVLDDPALSIPMMNSDDERKKQELLRIVAETKEIAPKLIEKGWNLTEAAQSALDWANVIENLAAEAPTDFLLYPIFTHVSTGFREFNSAALKQHGQITEDENLTRIVHATATTVSVASTSVAFVFGGAKAEETIPKLKPMRELLSRTVDTIRVQESMKIIGLDAAHGGKHSPVELLRIADEAFKRPFTNEGYESSVLLSLRESIQGAIDELLKRRPTTEKTASWRKKVTSIARCCGKIGMSFDFVDQVAATTDTLINELSGAKNRRMSRQDIATLFNEGVSLLRDIVSLIDPAKLRPVTK